MRTFASILDECLAAMARGATLEDCLGRYPNQADELRTQLLLARRLAATPRQQPRPGIQAASWQQFRAQAEDMRLGRRRRLKLNVNAGFGWLKPVAVMAALVLAVVFAGGGTIYAAQDVQPDNPLYGVKLATNDARLWFVFDESRKAEILLDQSDDRMTDIREMLRDGKEIPGNVLTDLRERNARAVRILEDKPDQSSLLVRAHDQSAGQEALLLDIWNDVEESAQDDYASAVATLHNAQLRTTNAPGTVRPEDVAAGVINISGAAVQVDDDVWSLGGVEVALDERTLGATNFEPGDVVSVVAARGSRGGLLALNVRPGAGDPAPQYSVSGTVEEIGDNEVVIAGQRISITDLTLLKLQLELGRQVEVEIDEVDGQAVASSVAGDGGDGPPPLAYEGVIEDEVKTSGVNNTWVIGGQEFLVTPSTDIDATAGDLTEGARARVEGVVQDGEAVASRVIVLEEEADEADVHVEGVFQRAGGGTWTVSGVEVSPPVGAQEPEAGSLVTVEGQRSDELLNADEVNTTPTPSSGGFAVVRGRVRDIDQDGSWRVGFVSVRADQSTIVSRPVEEGSRVFVWGVRDDDGDLRAAYVYVIPAGPSRQGSPGN
jgi:hypothetical protein